MLGVDGIVWESNELTWLNQTVVKSGACSDNSKSVVT